MKCQYCGEEKKNPGSHERFCKMNPKNVEEKEKTQEPSKQQEQTPLIITALHEYAGEDVAWFDEGKTSIKPVALGLVDGFAYALVMTVGGAAIPACMIKGFVGMYPKNQEFEQPKKEESKTELSQPEEPKKPIDNTPPSDRKIVISQPESPKEAIKESIVKIKVEEKESLHDMFMSIFRKKPKTNPSLSQDTKDLLKRLEHATT